MPNILFVDFSLDEASETLHSDSILTLVVVFVLALILVLFFASLFEIFMDITTPSAYGKSCDTNPILDWLYNRPDFSIGAHETSTCR